MTPLEVRLHYPLVWPHGWKRTPWPARSPFDHDRSFVGAREFLRDQVRLLGVRHCMDLTSDVQLTSRGLLKLGQGEPRDRGVAVYFNRGGQEVVFACDRWNRVACNVYAIGKHIEALRAQHRYGVGSIDQAFAGYLRLPSQGASGSAHQVVRWAAILGVAITATRAQIDDAYRQLAQERHPDHGGSAELMVELNQARADAYNWLAKHPQVSP